MMIFKDKSIWYIDTFMKMPQLNRTYPSGSEKRGKKKGRVKADEKWKCLLDRFVVIEGTGELAEESAASSIQVVNSSYVCLVQCFSNWEKSPPWGRF